VREVKKNTIEINKEYITPKKSGPGLFLASDLPTYVPTGVSDLPRGPKKKSVTPVVGGWVRGQKRTRVRFFWDMF
jgi:hypothetical protein